MKLKVDLSVNCVQTYIKYYDLKLDHFKIRGIDSPIFETVCL